MGKGNPVKEITNTVTKVVGNMVEAPFNVASGIVNGDVNKVLNGATKGVTGGTVSYDKKGGGLFNVTDTVGSVVGGLTGTTALKESLEKSSAAQAAQEKAAADAKAAAISRRRADLAGDTKTVFTTALGDVGGSAAGKTKKKTVLGG